VWGKDSVRPHYLFWSCAGVWFWGRAVNHVDQFHHLSHNHSITISRFEAAHFRFRLSLWHIHRMSEWLSHFPPLLVATVECSAIQTSSGCEQWLMREAEVGRFSTEFSGESETRVAHLVDMSHKISSAGIDIWHRVGFLRAQGDLAGLD